MLAKFGFWGVFLAVVSVGLGGTIFYQSIPTEGSIFDIYHPFTLTWTPDSPLASTVQWHLPVGCDLLNSTGDNGLITLHCHQPGNHTITASTSTEADSVTIRVMETSSCYAFYVSSNVTLTSPFSLRDLTSIELMIWVVSPTGLSEEETNGTALLPSVTSSVLTQQFFDVGLTPSLTISNSTITHIVGASTTVGTMTWDPLLRCFRVIISAQSYGTAQIRVSASACSLGYCSIADRTIALNVLQSTTQGSLSSLSDLTSALDPNSTLSFSRYQRNRFVCAAPFTVPGPGFVFTSNDFESPSKVDYSSLSATLGNVSAVSFAHNNIVLIGSYGSLWVAPITSLSSVTAASVPAGISVTRIVTATFLDPFPVLTTLPGHSNRLVLAYTPTNCASVLISIDDGASYSSVTLPSAVTAQCVSIVDGVIHFLGPSVSLLVKTTAGYQITQFTPSVGWSVGTSFDNALSQVRTKDVCLCQISNLHICSFIF